MLYSRNLLRSGTVIGCFKLDVGTVYNTPGKLSRWFVFLHLCTVFTSTLFLLHSAIGVLFFYKLIRQFRCLFLIDCLIIILWSVHEEWFAFLKRALMISEKRLKLVTVFIDTDFTIILDNFNIDRVQSITDRLQHFQSFVMSSFWFTSDFILLEALWAIQLNFGLFYIVLICRCFEWSWICFICVITAR